MAIQFTAPTWSAMQAYQSRPMPDPVPGGIDWSQLGQGYGAGSGIDPGIYAAPSAPFEGDPGIFASPGAPFDGDPGIHAAPPGTTASSETGTGGVGEIAAGEHVAHGAKSLIVPSLLGGVLSGALAAGTASSFKGLAFASRLVGATAVGIAGGAATGLLVAASSPKDGDSLAARYSTAGAVAGAATGAMLPGGLNRGLSAGVNAAGMAVLGWFVGSNLEKSHSRAQLPGPPAGTALPARLTGAGIPA